MSLLLSAYGLCLSSDRPIPGLPRLSAGRPIDLAIGFGPLPDLSEAEENESQRPEPRYVSDFLDENGRPGLVIREIDNGRRLRLIYSDGPEFVVDRDGTSLLALQPDGYPTHDLDSYLLGPVASLVLRLRGVTCVHASAVAVDGRAVLFAGPPSAGKSTLAMTLAGLGFPLLADDTVALSMTGGRVAATPSYPRARLRRLALDIFRAAGVSFSRPLPDFEEDRRLHLDVEDYGLTFQRGPLPVGGVYLLGLDNDPGGPRSVLVKGREGLIDLVGNSYAGRFLDADMRAQEFSLLAELVTQAPVRRLALPTDPADLRKLPRLITRDLDHAETEELCPVPTLSPAFA